MHTASGAPLFIAYIVFVVQRSTAETAGVHESGSVEGAGNIAQVRSDQLFVFDI